MYIAMKLGKILLVIIIAAILEVLRRRKVVRLKAAREIKMEKLKRTGKWKSLNKESNKDPIVTKRKLK